MMWRNQTHPLQLSKNSNFNGLEASSAVCGKRLLSVGKCANWSGLAELAELEAGGGLFLLSSSSANTSQARLAPLYSPSMAGNKSQIRDSIHKQLHGKSHQKQTHDADQDADAGFSHHLAHPASRGQHKIGHDGGDGD
jgi:hypothetical protein